MQRNRDVLSEMQSTNLRIVKRGGCVRRRCARAVDVKQVNAINSAKNVWILQHVRNHGVEPEFCSPHESSLSSVAGCYAAFVKRRRRCWWRPHVLFWELAKAPHVLLIVCRSRIMHRSNWTYLRVIQCFKYRRFRGMPVAHFIQQWPARCKTFKPPGRCAESFQTFRIGTGAQFAHNMGWTCQQAGRKSWNFVLRTHLDDKGKLVRIPAGVRFAGYEGQK